MEQKKNQFLVDLSPLSLSKEQLKSIDSAIQKAVSGELAKIHSIDKFKLIPIHEDDQVGGIFPWRFILGLILKPSEPPTIL